MADKVALRNFEGVITTYPEPENYVPGRVEGYFNEIHLNYAEKQSNISISGLMNDVKPSLVPEGLQRLVRRKQHESNLGHVSLKNKRQKRDQLKEKKFQAQMKKLNEGKQG